MFCSLTGDIHIMQTAQAINFDLGSLFIDLPSTANDVNSKVNPVPKLTRTITGVATWGSEPIEAFQNGKKAWLDDQGQLVQGIYVNMPDSEYHAIKGCLSSSCIKRFAFDPQGGYDYFTGNVEKKEISPQLKRSMTAGNLIHGHILEPWLKHYNITTTQTIEELQQAGHKVIENHDALKKIMLDYDIKGGNKKIADKVEIVRTEVDSSYVYYPDYIESVKDTPNVKFLERTDYDRSVKAAQVFVDSHLYEQNYRKCGYNELTIIAYDEETGLWLKARIDRVDHKNRMLDLKTIHTLSEAQVRRDLEEKLYTIQGAFYKRVADLAGFYLEDRFGLTFIEWDECIRYGNSYITDRSWEQSKSFEQEIYHDFVDWHRTAEQKNSLNYSGEMMMELSFYKLSRRPRVNS